jgi:hypothetical protein
MTGEYNWFFTQGELLTFSSFFKYQKLFISDFIDNVHGQ